MVSVQKLEMLKNKPDETAGLSVHATCTYLRVFFVKFEGMTIAKYWYYGIQSLINHQVA